MDAQKWLAAGVVVVCLALLVRLSLSPTRRARLDAWGRGAWRRLASGGWTAWRTRLAALWHWRRRRVNAARLTEQAIERARRARVDREGNVLRPDAFKSSRKKPHDKPH